MKDLHQLSSWLLPLIAILAALAVARAARKRLGEADVRAYLAGAYELIVAGVLDITNLSLSGVDFLGQHFTSYAPRYAVVQWLARLLYAIAFTTLGMAYRSGARPGKLVRSDLKRLAIDTVIVAAAATLFGLFLELLRTLDVLAW